LDVETGLTIAGFILGIPATLGGAWAIFKGMRRDDKLIGLEAVDRGLAVLQGALDRLEKEGVERQKQLDDAEEMVETLQGLLEECREARKDDARAWTAKCNDCLSRLEQAEDRLRILGGEPPSAQQ
jgi:chromosome segregation ATPase